MSCWSIVKRAWSDTTRSYGLTWGTGFRAIIVPIVTLVLVYVYIGEPAAMSGISVWVLAGVSAIGAGFLPLFLWNLWLAPLRIAEDKCGEAVERRIDPTEWQNIGLLPLYEVACLWVGIEPHHPIRNQAARAALSRLRSAMVAGKLPYCEGWNQRLSRVISGETPLPKETEMLSAIDLRRYADSTRHVPPFLQSVEVPVEKSPEPDDHVGVDMP